MDNEMKREAEVIEKLPIGKEQIRKASQILQKYKEGKANLERRLIENEEYWKLNHWSQMSPKHMNQNDPRPESAWLFNSINNKHADAMDNYPEPNILPREESDKAAAKSLSEIVPVILERCGYEDTYSSAWWDKLKGGTAVYGVFWNNNLMNGLGDVDIRLIDMLDIFWEPGIKRLEESRNLFIVELVDNEVLEESYPETVGKLAGSATMNIAQYHYDDAVDTSEKSAVVDWYYKKGNRLHYVKYVNDILLYASENEPEYQERGFYDDGKYPVVFDVLFEEKGTPAGFGYIDIMKDPQRYIDLMDGAILKNSVLLSRPRYFIRDSANVNEAEYADYSKDFVHVSGSLDDTGIKRVEVEQIPSSYFQVKQDKIEELKETSGNRDFSQGSTVSGVTAASAIAALQEAGSKTSRDMIKGAYRAYKKVCEKVIERVRQFYEEPRCFRITGPNHTEEFISFDNTNISPSVPGQEFGIEIQPRIPIFDIKVRPQKASPFSRISQNELAKELYGMGAFNPAYADQAYACIDMMDFEGKDSVMQKIRQNGLMYQEIQRLQQSMAQMAALIAETTGDTRISDALAAQQGYSVPETKGSAGSSEETHTEKNSTVGKAKARVAESTTPKV